MATRVLRPLGGHVAETWPEGEDGLSSALNH